MGMGEPMLNLCQRDQAATILSEPCGMAIAGKYHHDFDSRNRAPAFAATRPSVNRFRLVCIAGIGRCECSTPLMRIEGSYPRDSFIDCAP